MPPTRAEIAKFFDIPLEPSHRALPDAEATAKLVIGLAEDLRRGGHGRLIAGDVEDRSGKRALLNFGHTFAHAIESSAGLGSVLHGEAVAVGMVLALRFSAALGHCPTTDAERLVAHLAAVGLPTRLAEVGVAGPALLDWMMRDKKNERGALTLILARGIGAAFIERGVDPAALAAFLA